MRHRMPPLNPLRVFEVAARCDSFTQASVELCVTQAAVSRQITVLEEFFNLKLFDRDPRSLKLTPEGRRLYKEISPAFEMIGWATHEILRKRDGNIVTIQSYPTLTSLILLPKLAPFINENSDISVAFHNGVRPEDFVEDNADLFIRFGSGPLPERDGFKIANDRVAPAVSPELLAACGGDPDKLISGYPLLISKYRHSDWTDWANLTDRDIRDARFIHFDSSQLAYNAALQGLGMCCGQLYIVGNELAQEQLVQPFDEVLTRPLGYWVEWSSNRRVTPQMRKTLEWIRSLGEPEALNESEEIEPVIET